MAWRAADAQGRRELLGTLFEELDVQDGRIVGYRPRRDHEVEVAQLMDRLFERRTDARGCATVCREGAIDTSTVRLNGPGVACGLSIAEC